MKNRNEVIFERASNGETYASLAYEYGLTKTRIYQIVAREKTKREQNNDSLFKAVYKAMEDLGRVNIYVNANRIIGRLRAAKVYTIEDLKSLDLDIWKDSRCVGSASIEVVEKVLADA